jgi:uncharacterized OB-fold protein
MKSTLSISIEDAIRIKLIDLANKRKTKPSYIIVKLITDYFKELEQEEITSKYNVIICPNCTTKYSTKLINCPNCEANKIEQELDNRNRMMAESLKTKQQIEYENEQKILALEQQILAIKELEKQNIRITELGQGKVINEILAEKYSDDKSRVWAEIRKLRGVANG